MSSSGLSTVIQTDFLPFVQKPMQYLGNELNIIRKDPAAIELHGVLCFPETYEIGMSHYGGQILYHIVNSHPAWALSRCYLPQPDGLAQMRKRDIPLFCLEYQLPIKEADWIGFSITYELQFTNVLSILTLAKIPLRSKDRGQGFPLIIAGGCAMTNPEPIADFIDAFAIGDGEETVYNLCKELSRLKKEAASRPDTLKALSRINGVYVPSLHPVKREGVFMVPSLAEGITIAAKVDELKNDYYPARPLVPLINVVHHRLAVEVMRGCTRGCRFCAAGMTYRPIRERKTQDLISQLNESIDNTGWRDVGLLSLSTADYSDLKNLLSQTGAIVRDRHIDVSLPSTRIDALCDADIDLLKSVAPFSSFTIAPEAGTQRLRDVINKGFTDKNIFEMVDSLIKRKVQTIKLYFMIGLPTERPEDIDGIVTMVRDIASRAWNHSRRITINVAISPFSPKPHTPFAREAMDTVESLRQKSFLIKNSLKPNRNVKVSYRDPMMAQLETVMARGDRRLGNCIETAFLEGAQSDGRDEHFSYQRWQTTFEKFAIDPMVFCNAIEKDQPLPYRCISYKLSDDFLSQEYEKALQMQPTVDCRNDACENCGVCDEKTGTLVQSKSQDTVIAPDKETAAAIKPPEKFVFRFSYEKLSAMRFLGHLDMVNIFSRAFCAAEIPLAYTAGFHAHPMVSYGPPLSLPCEGASEMFDMTVSQKTIIDIDRINSFLPHGLRIKTYESIPVKHVSLNEAIWAGKYAFTLLREADESLVENIITAVQTFLSQTQVFVTVIKDEQPSQKEIRTLVHSIEFAPSSGKLSFTAVLGMLPRKTCKPAELLTGLGYSDSSSWLIRREKCIINRET